MFRMTYLDKIGGQGRGGMGLVRVGWVDCKGSMDFGGWRMERGWQSVEVKERCRMGDNY